MYIIHFDTCIVNVLLIHENAYYHGICETGSIFPIILYLESYVRFVGMYIVAHLVRDIWILSNVVYFLLVFWCCWLGFGANELSIVYFSILEHIAINYLCFPI